MLLFTMMAWEQKGMEQKQSCILPNIYHPPFHLNILDQFDLAQKTGVM